MKARVEVRCGRGTVNVYDIDGSEAVVGSSTDATISLPALAELDPKHMLLVPRGKRGCWVSVAEGVRTPVKIGNDVLTNAMVPWGTDLQVGSISVRPCLSNPRGSRTSAWRAGLFIVALGGLALAAMFFARDDAAATMQSGGARAHPTLFGEQSNCPSREDPLRSGIRAEEMARSRADRYPYDPRDGVRAVQGYRVAASCYDVAGRPSDADRTRGAAQELAGRVVADYAAARLSLANAIEAERWADVLRETRHLQLLTSHLGGHEYVEWLKKIVGKATARRHGPP